MSKKKELLNRYIDINFRYIKYFFPMLIEEIDISKLKEEINDNNKVAREKEKIDIVFKDKICEYLDAKFDIAKKNLLFLDNEYDKFDFDYELCNKLLWLLNYKYKEIDIEFPTLRDDFTIKDAKKIVKDFYREILKNNPNDVNLMNYIIDNKLNIIYDNERAFTDVKTSDINITYANDLSFLIVIAHELAHSYAYFRKTNLMGSEDVRNVEIESSFVEKLLLKYLKENKFPIIRENNNNRPVNEEDIDKYYAAVFYSTLTYAYRIIDEMDFIDNLSEDFVINRQNFDDYVSNSPYEYNYIVQADFINDILDNYIPEETKNINIKDLKEVSKKLNIYNYNEFGSFKFSIRYVFSYLMSLFFDDISKEEKNINYFIEFLDNKNDYSCKDLIDLFSIDIEDTMTLPTAFLLKYKDILNKKGDELKINPYITQDFINSEIKNYKKMIKKNKDDKGLEQKKMILIRKIFHLLDKTKINNDMYPFDISSQLDDADVDKIDELEKKLIQLL